MGDTTTPVSAQSIRNEYTVDERGIIRNPGKFEGEHFSTPYFFDLYLDGWADETDDGRLEFEPSDAECQAFGLLYGCKVFLSVDDCGFVTAEHV